jgi:hypothetical protein
VTWPGVLLACLICHVGGDYLLQTEWQATTKGRGVGDPEGRRALFLHVITYTAAFLPALAWIAARHDIGWAVLMGLAVAVPHLLIDDGSVVRWWLRYVKHVAVPDRMLRLMVDQSMHLVCLLGVALITVA